MSTAQTLEEHYRHGRLEEAIDNALREAGKELERPRVSDLALVDEFHVGGRSATRELAWQMGIRGKMHFLDIGCGIGGAARCFAHEYGSRVTGVDLNEEYITVAESLTRRTGLAEKVDYRRGSALELPFDNETFDGAYMIHVGMNIEDKQRLFAEVRRVIKTRGVFGVYDIMREGPGELTYPVPWASNPSMSFLEDIDTYKRLLQANRLVVQRERSRRKSVIDAAARARNEGGGDGPPPLGLHILMGENAAAKIANVMDGIERGGIAPNELICAAI